MIFKKCSDKDIILKLLRGTGIFIKFGWSECVRSRIELDEFGASNKMYYSHYKRKRTKINFRVLF